YEEIDGGFVAFGGNSKRGKITGKGKIRTGKLDFEDVYFVKELKFNLFSVSQMCDKKNSVLFTDTECVVLSIDFKLTDESHVLLKVPRKDNMYSVDLKNVVPQGGLTCLFAKATPDESNLWHRRLGHVNFKTMNKLGERVDQEKDANVNSTNNINNVSSTVNVAGIKDNTIDENIVYGCVVDPNMPDLEEIGRFSDAENDDSGADINNLNTYFQVSPVPTTRIHKDHPLNQVIRDLQSATQTRQMTKNLEEYGVLSDFLLHRSSINNSASLSNKFREAYFIFKFGISDLLHQVVITIADRIRDVCLRQELLKYMVVHVNDASESSKPSWRNTAPNAIHISTILEEEKCIWILIDSGAMDFNIGERDKEILYHYKCIQSIQYVEPDSRKERLFFSIVQFSENTPNIVGSGPNWLFDIDALTKSMNYKPIVVGNQSNDNAGTKACDNAGKARVETVPGKDYILLPLWTQDPPFSSSSKDSPDAGFKPSGRKRRMLKIQGMKVEIQLKGKIVSNGNNTNNVNAVSSTVNAAGTEVNAVDPKTSIKLLNDLNMPELEDIESKSWNRSYARRASSIQITKVLDPGGIYQMEKAIGTKWVYRNKKDERGIVIKSKARLVSQGYIQEEGIDYDEMSRVLSYGKFEEEVNVYQPPGFEDPDFPNRVYKVEKALYGLHQALRAWYETLSTYLLENGFQRGIGVNDGDSKLMLLGINLLLLEKVNAARHNFLLLVAWLHNLLLLANATAKVKTVNGEVQLHALVDRKKVIITESTIRRDLQLEDAEVLDLENTKTAQAQEITSLKKIVKKLERKKKSRTHGLKRLYKVCLSARIDSSDDEASLGDQEDASKQGRKIHDIDVDEDINLENVHDADMFGVHDLDGDEVFVETEEHVVNAATTTRTILVSAAKDLSDVDMSLAQALAKLKSTKPKAITTAATTTTTAVTRPKAKGIEERITREKEEANAALIAQWNDIQVKVETDYELVQRLQAEEQEELTIKEKSKLFQQLLEKRRKHFTTKRAEERRNRPPTKAQQRSIMVNIFVDMDTELVGGSEVREECSETREEGSETREESNSKRADAGDDVTIKAIPLSTKSLTIIRFGVLWSIVKARFKKTEPVNYMDIFLHLNLKIMFEQHLEDSVWKNQQGLVKVVNWKIYDSCGVHCVTMQNILYYKLVEKMYPLTKHTLHQMFNEVKLQVDYECKMAFKLLRLVNK
ncbi:ribonuclease H-like domain-containing protein, partial [Tanacetum coccineum]